MLKSKDQKSKIGVAVEEKKVLKTERKRMGKHLAREMI